MKEAGVVLLDGEEFLQEAVALPCMCAFEAKEFLCGWAEANDAPAVWVGGGRVGAQ